MRRIHRVNLAIRVLLFTNALVLLAAALFGPIYALFVAELGGGLLDAGLTSGVYAITAVFTTIIAGAYTDKLKENEYVIICGYFIIGLAFFLLNFVKTIEHLFLVEMLTGFGTAIYSPAFSAIYSNHVSYEKPGTEWSFWDVIDNTSYAIGAVLGGYLASTFGFPILFNLMASLCLISGLYIYFLPREVL